MRFGRNVGRTFFEYYRFTNVLSIPLLADLKPRKGRPKTHRSRNRRRLKPDVRPRPRTTREYAPINYMDLNMHYESSTSNEGSPVRYGFGSRGNANIYMNMNVYATNADTKPDQFSLINIQASKFDHLDFTTNEFRQMNLPKDNGHQQSLGGAGATASVLTAPTRLFNDVQTVNIAPKPYLSIIDFNQLTRGGLERAKAKKSTTTTTATVAGQH